jgi:hypothetical protein
MRTLKPNKADKLAALTVRQVRWARAQHGSGRRTIGQLAEHLRVSYSTVNFMLNRRTYANVE